MRECQWERPPFRGHLLAWVESQVRRSPDAEGPYPSDDVVVNPPPLDDTLGPTVGVNEPEHAKHIRGAMQLGLAVQLGLAMQLGLSSIYWMQTEAPRGATAHAEDEAVRGGGVSEAGRVRR